MRRPECQTAGTTSTKPAPGLGPRGEWQTCPASECLREQRNSKYYAHGQTQRGHCNMCIDCIESRFLLSLTAMCVCEKQASLPASVSRPPGPCFFQVPDLKCRRDVPTVPILQSLYSRNGPTKSSECVRLWLPQADQTFLRANRD